LNTQFKESFLKDLRAIKDRDLLARVNEIIQAVEKAQTPQEIPTLKKLRGERNCFHMLISQLITLLQRVASSTQTAAPGAN
jgi:hypothetical protein